MVRVAVLVGLLVQALVPWAAIASTSTVVPGKIVFASDRDGDYDIFVMNGDGSDRKKLTFNNVDDYYPDWSPNGSRIAFVSTFKCPEEVVSCHDTYPNLMVMRADGSHKRRIGRTAGYEREPAWSPDGKWLAFASGGLEEDGGDVRIVRLDGSDEQPISMARDNSTNRSPSWSPSGKRLALEEEYDSSGQVYVTDPIGERETHYRGKRQVSTTGGTKEDIEWSPDGDWIGYSDTGDSLCNFCPQFLFAVQPDGSNPHEIETGFYDSRFGSWSRDSKMIIFSARRSRRDTYNIYAMNSDGTDLVRITDHPASEIHADWFQGP